ncbi:MAG: hypothetical protein HC906_00190 [Bacteroidales bacterium]|nr:hypothetical protein [Bacteroidales bacterium]
MKTKCNGLIFISGFFLILLSKSCYYDSEEYLFGKLNSDCDTSNITFSGSVYPILQNSCLSCHSNSASSALGGNIRLENYDNIKQRADDGSLLGAVSHQSGYSQMPKGAAKLDDCKLLIIEKWINAGSPNN